MATPEAKDIESLVELFNRSDWDEMHIKTDDLEMFLSNDPNATGPAHAPAAQAAAVGAASSATAAAPTTAPVVAAPAAHDAIPDGMIGVRAPNLGTFYRAPKPGAAPYVEVGQTIEADTEVCLIEVMKLFTPVRAGTAGVVREVCIADGQMVEFGQLLVVIEPA
jgi:acetyl-CoA carboxylase biotin carboxyl carrier protein